jgi:tetratricopeptide (TPR) repeat protein
VTPAVETPRWHRALPAAIAASALAFDPGAASAKTPKLALIGVLTIAALVLSLRRKLRIPGAALLWLATVGWLAISLAWSPRPSTRLLLAWAGSGALAIVLGAVSESERRALAGRAAAIMIAISSGAAAVSWMLGARGIAVHGLMGNPNWLGLVVAVAMPLAVGHLAHTTNHERTLIVVSLALGVFGLMLGGSRVAMVGLAGAALTLPMPRRRRAVALGAAAAGTGALIAIGGLTSLRGRIWLGQVGIDAWLERPFRGHGLGGFGDAFLTAQGPRLAAMDVERAAQHFLYATNAHNDWLQLGIEGGVVALGLALVTFAVALLDLRDARWRAGMASLVVVAITMLGDAPLRQPAIALLLAFPLACSRRLAARRRDLAMPAICLLAAVVLLPSAGTRWLAERTAARARDASPEDRLATLQKARRIAPDWSAPRLALAVTLLELGDGRAALEALDEAPMTGLAPRLARGHARMLLGDHPGAVDAYQAALAIHPGSFRAHTNLAEALRRRGDLDAAAEQLRLATVLQPHHPKLTALAERIRRDRIDSMTR